MTDEQIIVIIERQRERERKNYLTTHIKQIPIIQVVVFLLSKTIYYKMCIHTHTKYIEKKFDVCIV